MGTTLGVVVALHVVGFGLVAVPVLSGQSNGLTLGTVALAYLAGLKHQADADHISAIDNATRKFVADGRRPVSVGLAFSLGHSTIVFIASLVVVFGARGMSATFNGDNNISGALGSVGSAVAGGFLILVGTVNAVSLLTLVRKRSCHRDGAVAPTAVGRMLTVPLRRMKHPCHLFALGLMFGLGFDTASLVGLLVLAATSAATSGIAVVTVLALPVCFAAGMTLGDTVNGMAMMRLYASASADSTRRGDLNIAITAMSVLSAFTIGGIIVVSLLRTVWGLDDRFSRCVAGINLEYAGFAMIGIFAVVWVGVGVRCTPHRHRSPPPESQRLSDHRTHSRSMMR
ncbi:HoxN/HupN/NixA family nickel/cobalt transporter [Williamsia sterculiae]|uniref:HoxN/HupN/NixA family nickel/cobalt transporter n=1 Tax=Williamsia sterculiae TaxID=1344003 RepID=UPI0009714057|nr:hypothetical protein [Williamsia sterculiae]